MPPPLYHFLIWFCATATTLLHATTPPLPATSCKHNVALTYVKSFITNKEAKVGLDMTAFLGQLNGITANVPSSEKLLDAAIKNYTERVVLDTGLIINEESPILRGKIAKIVSEKAKVWPTTCHNAFSDRLDGAIGQPVIVNTKLEVQELKVLMDELEITKQPLGLIAVPAGIISRASGAMISPYAAATDYRDFNALKMMVLDRSDLTSEGIKSVADTEDIKALCVAEVPMQDKNKEGSEKVVELLKYLQFGLGRLNKWANKMILSFDGLPVLSEIKDAVNFKTPLPIRKIVKMLGLIKEDSFWTSLDANELVKLGLR